MMARPSAKARTPVAEWIAAAIGGTMALGVIGYTVFEGVAAGDGHPRLTVKIEPPRRSGAGYVAQFVVSNDAHATAAAVEIRGVLNAGGAIVEERRVVIAYVPGKGEARGGLIFERDPRAYVLSVTPEGYEEP
jgi:uncharacterized protein (TIGR02588 family)